MRGCGSPGSICIVDLVFRDGEDRISLGCRLFTGLRNGSDSWFCPLGDDDCPWPLGIPLGILGNKRSDLWDRLRGVTLGCGPCKRFCLVAYQVIRVGQDLGEWVFEELWNERR